jgi:hypothetical protein
MAKCWLNTWVVRAKTAGIDLGLGNGERFLHQTQCGYCDVPRDLLIRALEEFQEWSGISSFEDVPLRAEIEAFETMHKAEQQRLVAKAAGLNIADAEHGLEPADARDWWNTPG